MAATNTRIAAGLSKSPDPISCSEDLNVIHPANPGSELLEKAETLKEILDYVEQQAATCKFRDLSLFVGTARLAANELVQALYKNRGEN